MAHGVDLPLSKLREIAVLATADPRTVARVIRGETVLPLPAGRIRAVLKRLGMRVKRKAR